MSSANSSEVLAYCGSCKMDLNSRIVAKVGSKIVKVQCRTCKKEHSYRPPKGVTEPGMTPTKTVTRTRTASTRSSGRDEDNSKSAVSVQKEWSRLMQAAQTAKRIPYSIKAQLTQGDVVQHPTFGEGVVMKINHPDKAEIIFKTDVKLLIHSR